MIRIALCDDSTEFLTQIKTAIDQWANTSFNMLSDTFTDGDELLQAHFLYPYEIIIQFSIKNEWFILRVIF